MRRVLLVLAFALLAAGAFGANAFAKEGGVELSSTPAGLGPGDPWTPTLTLIDVDGRLPANAKPGITIRSLEGGETIDYRAAPTETPGVYSVRVVFPSAGRWEYSAYDGVTGRLYEYPPTTIVAPQAALPAVPPAPRQQGEGAFPLWPLLGGLGGAALLALGAVVAIRSGRFRHAH